MNNRQDGSAGEDAGIGLAKGLTFFQNEEKLRVLEKTQHLRLEQIVHR